MTTEEAKKAGFRHFDKNQYVYWQIAGEFIHQFHCYACSLREGDFSTRAKAREALRKRKMEEATKREDARIAARKAAGTHVPPPAPSETPAERDSRIKALVDSYKAKGGPITKEQLTDEVFVWLQAQGKDYFGSRWQGATSGLPSYRNLAEPTFRFDKVCWPSKRMVEERLVFWNKPDAEHAKWLADMQSQMTPITPEQAKHKPCDMPDEITFNGAEYRRLADNEQHKDGDIPVDGSQTHRFGSIWYRPVASHETPVGETQSKEVVTDETQRSPSKLLSDVEFKKLVGRMSLPQLYDALKFNGVKLEGISLDPKKVDDQSILEEAAKCVTGPRRRDYGTPDENFGLIAKLWSLQLHHEVTPSDVAMCLILLKVARQCNSPKRDNLVDIAGYAQCASELKGAK